MKITVLLGGSSEERDVSLSSGTAVAAALREMGHQVVAFDTLNGPLTPERQAEILSRGIGHEPPAHAQGDLAEEGRVRDLLAHPEVRGTELFFPILHGGAGEDGRVQTLLEMAGVPFVGTGRVGSFLAMDKEVSKALFRLAEIPTPDWGILDTGGMAPEPGRDRFAAWGEAAEELAEELGFPLIVKPPSGGSTVGLTLVHEPRELAPALELAASLEPRIMMERYVLGRELTVGIVGDEALGVGEIIPEHELFDYECKYQPGMAQEIFPADLPEALAEGVREIALEVHRLLRLADFSRVDFILDSGGTPWVLEANTLPGMSPSSLLPKCGQAAGLSFPQLCQRIVDSAVERNNL